MTEDDIDVLIEIDSAWSFPIRRRWTRLIELAVWGDLRSANLGTVGKMRRRALELGEKWRSVCSDRKWIPRKRERAKNFLGSCLNLRDSLVQLEKAASELDGGADYAEFGQLLIEIHQVVVGPLAERENKVAAALDSLNKAALQDEEADD